MEEIENNVVEKKSTTKTKVDYTKIIEEQRKQIEAMQQQMQQMSAMFAMLQQGGLGSVPQPNKKENVAVSCRAFSGIPLCTTDESIQYFFEVGDVKDIPIDDLKQLLKENGKRNNKKLFEKGLLCFVDEEDYKAFGIKPRVDLSVENIKRIVTEPDIDKMIREVKTMTKDKVDWAVTHSLKFTIAQMWVDKENQPLKNWAYENRVALENYFGNKFDDLIASIGLNNFVKQSRHR